MAAGAARPPRGAGGRRPNARAGYGSSWHGRALPVPPRSCPCRAELRPARRYRASPGLAQLLNLRMDCAVRMLCDRSASWIARTRVSAHFTAAIAWDTRRLPRPLISSSAAVPVAGAAARHRTRRSMRPACRGCPRSCRAASPRTASHHPRRSRPGSWRQPAMGDVRVTAPARLALMPGCRHVIGPLDAFNISIGPGDPEDLAQAGRASSWQAGDSDWICSWLVIARPRAGPVVRCPGSTGVSRA